MKNIDLSQVDFCVIDTETTGGRAATNRIIDVAVFHFREGEIVDKYQSLINPQTAIPDWITMLTGISDRMVEEAPTFDQILKPLKNILSKGIFVAHNAPFDYGFVREEFLRCGEFFESPQCCTLKLARHLYPELRSKSLDSLSDHLLIDIMDRHRAAGDAEATVYVLKEMIRELKSKHSIQTLNDLEGFQKFGRMQLPETVKIQHLTQLPDQPGAYIFKDSTGRVVLKGKCKNVQRRVRTFFQASNQSDKSNLLRETIRTIEYSPN